jgi:hypothetical protein
VPRVDQKHVAATLRTKKKEVHPFYTNITTNSFVLLFYVIVSDLSNQNFRHEKMKILGEMPAYEVSM